MANYRGANDGSEPRTSFKVVLLGEGAVGKTSLVLQYIENKFNDKHISTLQVFYWLTVKCELSLLQFYSATDVLWNSLIWRGWFVMVFECLVDQNFDFAAHTGQFSLHWFMLSFWELGNVTSLFCLSGLLLTEEVEHWWPQDYFDTVGHSWSGEISCPRSNLLQGQ